MQKPKIGPMRVPVEWGEIKSIPNDDGGLDRGFVKKGFFWARRMGVGSQEGSDIRSDIDGVDVSDDITKLRTWRGHPITSQHYLRMNGQVYSIIGITDSNDGREVDYTAVSGLRDLVG